MESINILIEKVKSCYNVYEKYTFECLMNLNNCSNESRIRFLKYALDNNIFHDNTTTILARDIYTSLLFPELNPSKGLEYEKYVWSLKHQQEIATKVNKFVESNMLNIGNRKSQIFTQFQKGLDKMIEKFYDDNETFFDVCPISLDIIYTPCILPCGHKFEKKSIDQLIQKKCPLCRTEF